MNYTREKRLDIEKQIYNNEIMSRAGTPTDNAAMKFINGWIKSELFTDFHLTGENIGEEIAEYIKFFDGERPACSLGYLTPKQYRETYAPVH